MSGTISVRQLSQRLQGEKARELLLLDVREDEERAVALIEPSLHIPMGEVPDRLGELAKDRTIIVYCHHGSRSAMVAEYLTSEGFPSVLNLTGGIDAWSAEIDPRVARYS